MALLVPEGGEGLDNANTYVDQAYADSYFSNIGETEWDTYNQFDKENAILKAAIVIDNKYGSSFRGNIWSNEQSMLFPRFTFYDSKGRLVLAQTIPEDLKRSQCEFAFLSITGTDLFDDPNKDGTGITNYSTSVGRGAFSESNTYATPTRSTTYDKPVMYLKSLLWSTARAVRG